MNADQQKTANPRALRIAMLTTVWGEHAIGGAERMAERLARSWASDGHTLHMVALGCDVPQGTEPLTAHAVALFQAYDPYGLKPSDVGLKPGPKQRPGWQKAIWHALDVYNPVMGHRLDAVWARIRPDVVVSHNLQGFSVAAWRSIRRTSALHIHVVHDHSLLCPATAMTRGKTVCQILCSSCSVLGGARRMMACMPDVVVAPSAAVLERHLQNGWFSGPETVKHVIPNAIADDWPQAQHGGRFAEGGPTPAEPPHFGFVGRLDESKGVDILLDAALQCQGHWNLSLAGPGDLAHWQGQIDARGLSARVRLLGPLTGALAVQNFMRSCHVLLTPSRAAETFSSVVLEAACLGVPAMVANIGALPERIGFLPHQAAFHAQAQAGVHKGPSGWMVPAGDAHAWASAMQHCIDSPEEVQMCADAALQWREQHREVRIQRMWSEVLVQAVVQARHRAA